MSDDIVERLRVLLRCRCEPDAACCEACSAVDAIADELDRLRSRLAEKDASIARLKRTVDSDDGMDSFCDDLLEQFGPMQVQIDRLRARLAEAERDATRYRWLRGNASQGSERWMRWELRRWDGRSWHSLEFAALDAAIDAAMERQP